MSTTHGQNGDLPREPTDAEVRAALRHFASGVTIVTARHEEELCGVTVSAFASITLDPPTIMVSIKTTSSIISTIIRSERFAVHILAADQRDLSDRFARPIPGWEKFGDMAITMRRNGAPGIPGVLATLECSVVRMLYVGTHTMILGQVTHVEALDAPGHPLLYYHCSYYGPPA